MGYRTGSPLWQTCGRHNVHGAYGGWSRYYSRRVCCQVKLGTFLHLKYFFISSQRMAQAGAPIIGLNCLFDPFICLETMRLMKEALDAAGLKPFLMTQPLGFRTPDAARYGWITLPEFPHGNTFQCVTIGPSVVRALLVRCCRRAAWLM